MPIIRLRKLLEQEVQLRYPQTQPVLHKSIGTMLPRLMTMTLPIH